MPPHKTITPDTVGMTGLMVKNQNASGGSWNFFPDSVKKNSDLLDEKMFSCDKLTVEVAFSDLHHTKINYSTGAQTPINMVESLGLIVFRAQTKISPAISKNDAMNQVLIHDCYDTFCRSTFF